MNIQLKDMINNEIEHFINIFILNGWVREDTEIIRKKVEFIVHPEFKNNKNKICLCLYPEILYYYDNNQQNIKIWIAFKFETTKDNKVKYQSDSITLNKIGDWLKAELKKMNLIPFKDEDSFNNIFSKPEIKDEWVSFNFYLNKDYPNGYWCNHTL